MADASEKTNSSSSPADDVFNVPNQISAARLVLSIVCFALISTKMFWAALIVFVIAAGTDWIDGWYARKFNLTSKLGRALDTFCDKILICGTFILIAIEMEPHFSWYGKIAGWMAVVVVGRELFVTLLRSMIEGAGGDFSANLSGKLKMGLQCVAVGSCLVALAIETGDGQTFDQIPTWLLVIVIASVWLSIVSTVHSAWIYVNDARKFWGN